MAMSSCPTCKSHLFELKGIEPSGSRFKLNAVQCSACGTVVGILDYVNIGVEVGEVKDAVKRLKADVDSVKLDVQHIAQALSRR